MKEAKPYPKYKLSGVDWLGEVPEHWNVLRLKNCFRLLTNKTEDKQNSIALENIESWTGRFIETETQFEGEGVAFQEGDILFGKLRPYLAKVYRASGAGEAVGDFFVMSPKKECDSNFAAYFLRSREFISVVDGSSYGAKMPRVSWEFMSGLPVPYPSSLDQRIIAKFLDQKISYIDTLIAKKERMIELLKKKRASLISHTITKGLNPDAKMKSSGVDWLGEVPEHWTITRLKFLIREPLTYGANESAEDDNPENPRFIRITDIDNNGQLREDTFCSLPYDIAAPFLLEEGDILLARSGATVGKSFRYRKSWGVCCFAGYLIRARVNRNKLLAEFLDACCQSDFYWKYILESQIQATIQNVSAEKYANLNLPIPPIIEQRAITEFLDRETKKIDALVEKVNDAVLKLKEYRSAVISAAVTGKIDVREETQDAAHR